MKQHWIFPALLLLGCAPQDAEIMRASPDLSSSVLTREELARAMATPSNSPGEFEFTVPGRVMPQMVGGIYLSTDRTGRVTAFFQVVSYYPQASGGPHFHVDGTIRIGTSDALPTREPDGGLVVRWRGDGSRNYNGGASMSETFLEGALQTTISRALGHYGDNDIELRIDRRGLFVLTITGTWFQDFGSNDDPRGRIGRGSIKGYGRLSSAGCAALCLGESCQPQDDPMCTTQPRVAEFLRGWM
jgi:hypothetical protein